MNDILAAISTVITVIAILYSLWYQDIDKAISAQLPEHEADQEEPKKQLKSVLYNKSIPLFVVSLVFFFLYSPTSIKIMGESIEAFSSKNCTFDPIKASIIFINLLGLLFTIITFLKAVALIRKIKK